MRNVRLATVLFALLALALLGGAMLLTANAPQALAAPLLVLTASAEPPTVTPTSPAPTVTPGGPTVTPGGPTVTPGGPTNTPVPGLPGTPTAGPPPTEEPERPDRQADPAVSKEADKDEVGLGEEINFSITVTNEGNDLAIGVIVEDSLPSYLALVSASIDKGQTVINGNTVGFWIGDVEPGEVIRGTITARVVAVPQEGEGSNEVVLRSSNSSDRPENNRSNTRFRVRQPVASPTAEPTGQITPSPSPVPVGPTPTPRPPSDLPVTATSMGLPYGLLLLAGIGYMAVGLYLWLRPRRRQ